MALSDVKIIDIPKICDPRGNLSFVEYGRTCLLDIRRAGW